MTAIIGIDPGISGALCLLGGDEPEIWDMPVLELRGKKRVDATALAHTFERWAEFAPTVWIEDVATRPGEGAVGAFSFGRSVGVLHGLAAAHFMPVSVVRPATWKKAMGIAAGSDKDASRAKASELCPRYANHWALKKHDGRAESLLIAMYGRMQG